MAAKSATNFAIMDPKKSHKLWPEAPGETVKPFLRNVLGNISTTGFICKHLLSFQLHMILAGVDTSWILCGVFSSNSKSQKHRTLQLVEGRCMLIISLATKFCQILTVLQNVTN